MQDITRPPKRTPIYDFGAIEEGQYCGYVAPHPADRRRVLSAASHYKKRHPGWDYQSESFNGGIRIWRA